MLLRADFSARGAVVAARLYATALGAYEARINGQLVSDAVLAPEISVARDHVLPTDPPATGARNDSFYNISMFTLSVSRNF